MRNAAGLDARIEVLKKYGVSLTEEEMLKLHSGSRELSDDDLDAAAGGFEPDGEWGELALII